MSAPIRCSPSSAMPMTNGHESSSLRPLRDSDSPLLIWKKYNQVLKQVRDLEQSIGMIGKSVNSVRRRMLGTVNPPLVGMVWRGEWYDGDYHPQEVVVVSSGSNQGTYVCNVPVTKGDGNSPWLGGGFWTQLPAQLGAAKWF